MDRWSWMPIKAYAPAVAALLFAALSMNIVSDLQVSPLLIGFVRILSWVPLLGLAAAAWLIAMPTFRLWCWHRGGISCPTCSGPLGREREGYASRGGAYRRCYVCGDNVNHRHYE